MTAGAEELDALLLDVCSTLGTEGTLSDFGVSRRLDCLVQGRNVRLLATESDYQIAVFLVWATFPKSAAIFFAPDDSYGRAKFFESPSQIGSTGDREFDANYVVVGAAARELAGMLSPDVRSTLVEQVSIRPEVQWFDSLEMAERFNVTVRPPVCEYPEKPPPIGFGAMSSVALVRAVLRTIELSAKLEALA